MSAHNVTTPLTVTHNNNITSTQDTTESLSDTPIKPLPLSPSTRRHSNGSGIVDQNGFGSIEGVDLDRVGLYAPHSHYVDALLTDQYQISMSYAYWTANKHNDSSVFDLFFRKPPFDGEFTIFAGLEEVLRYVHTFQFTAQMIDALQSKFPHWNTEFWPWLASLKPDVLKIYAIQEGTIVIPNVPLIRVEGPLALCQLLETTFLTLTNFPSLIATNAARHRLAAGKHKTLIEFGLRRAQGPDGAMSASRYAYIGGFDATSNVRAGLQFNIPVSGTHAHAFVTSFVSLTQLRSTTLLHKQSNTDEDFVSAVITYRKQLKRTSTHQGELAAFISYAQAFPDGFLALVDTYDTLESGIWNFICVALALHQFGYTARGVRLDSGDLAYLSRECRKLFVHISDQYSIQSFARISIVASNDLSEHVLYALKEQGHEIDAFGIGTHLVTCKTQPALGCVYKLTQVNNEPRMKLSNDSRKITIPGRKECYRLYNAAHEPVIDLLLPVGQQPPQPHKRILCRHPFDANKRCYVTPSKVESLHRCVWDGRLTAPFPSAQEIKHHVKQQLDVFREDHLRRLNPTPYKLSVTADLYTFMHELWLAETPISEIM